MWVGCSGSPVTLGGGGGERGVLPDGICCAALEGIVFKQLSLGYGIEIREQLFDRKGFGKMSLV